MKIVIILLIYMMPIISVAVPGSYDGNIDLDDRLSPDSIPDWYGWAYLAVLAWLVYGKIFNPYDYDMNWFAIPLWAALVTGMVVMIGIYAIVLIPIYVVYKHFVKSSE
jgi:hypothetical protein